MGRDSTLLGVNKEIKDPYVLIEQADISRIKEEDEIEQLVHLSIDVKEQSMDSFHFYYKLDYLLQQQEGLHEWEHGHLQSLHYLKLIFAPYVEIGKQSKFVISSKKVLIFKREPPVQIHEILQVAAQLHFDSDRALYGETQQRRHSPAA